MFRGERPTIVPPHNWILKSFVGHSKHKIVLIIKKRNNKLYVIFKVIVYNGYIISKYIVSVD